MAWVVGIDEAGYGPNLGPLVMTAVACRVPDGEGDADLWQLLEGAVRRGGSKDDGRLLVDDSKLVYASGHGLRGLERGVLATVGRPQLGALAALVEHVCPDHLPELRGEAWYTGVSPLPAAATADDLGADAANFAGACAAAGVTGWAARSVVVCAPRFNALLDQHGSKGAVLADALAVLLRGARDLTPGDDAVGFFIDKHGGRNAYAAQVQHGLDGGMVVGVEEGMSRSAYRVHGLGRPVALTFQPRADQQHFAVALASMASKYLRELLMGEFNAFWRTHVPGLKPTAGYPGDAARFLEAIRPAAQKLKLSDEAIWRRK